MSAETTDPSVLVTPDQSVFTSNYPCPVFIFRHFDSRPFIPTQITLWSKMHTESTHGYPVGQGLIFVADSPIDLLDTTSAKQFEGFNKKDFLAWKQRRFEMLGPEPLKPHEPIAFFDFGEQEKLDLDIHFRSSCRYIKVMPTRFRD